MSGVELVTNWINDKTSRNKAALLHYIEEHRNDDLTELGDFISSKVDTVLGYNHWERGGGNDASNLTKIVGYFKVKDYTEAELDAQLAALPKHDNEITVHRGPHHLLVPEKDSIEAKEVNALELEEKTNHVLRTINTTEKDIEEFERVRSEMSILTQLTYKELQKATHHLRVKLNEIIEANATLHKLQKESNLILENQVFGGERQLSAKEIMLSLEAGPPRHNFDWSSDDDEEQDEDY